MAVDYLFLFHTPLGVIRLKKALAARHIAYRVIDAPRQLTAECAMAIEFALTEESGFQPLLNAEVCAVYRLGAAAPVLLWRDES